MRRLTTAVLALVLLGSTPTLAADYNHDRDTRHQSDYRDNNRHNDNDRRSNFNRNRWHSGAKLDRVWWLYTPVDWRRHHFRTPSYGTHWIYVDGYFLLVDRRGVVLEVVSG